MRFWILAIWAAAIVSLSQLFEAGRQAAAGIGGLWLAETAVWAVLFAGSLFLLTLRMYAVERARGNVVRRVGVFERLLEGGEDGA